MLNYTFTKDLRKTLNKLAHKDKKLALAIRKKIIQIASMSEAEITEHFKNLRGPMSHLKRVHIGSFVLTFSIEKDIIIFKRFVHHDKAY